MRRNPSLSHECGKAIARRLQDPAFHRFYFVGRGLDVGGGYDGLENYARLFPGIVSVRNWDIADGDGMLLPGVEPASYDFVHSSHCLEHLRDPYVALQMWFRVLRPGGHLIVLVPDEDLYEQGVWPSTFNPDHKHTFTIWKGPGESWSPVSVNVVELVQGLGQAQLLSLRLLEATYFYGLPRVDQTGSVVGECAIEFVVRKTSAP
jgi:SAM-dependent methyltransferase